VLPTTGPEQVWPSIALGVGALVLGGGLAMIARRKPATSDRS
jgi:LPXTG-motif cell wall-anchored protein